LIEFREFRPADIEALRDSAAETYARPWMTPEMAGQLNGETMLLDGAVVAAGGLYEAGGGDACAWAALASQGVSVALEAVRRMRLRLRTANYRRIEAHVVWDFHASHRFVRLLGFDLDRDRPTLLIAGTVMARYVYGESR
jgi:hypothetical protein